MTDAIQISGLKQVQRRLYSYSQQLGDRVVIGSLRQGANVVLRAARSNAPMRTGKLRKGIRVSRSKIHRGRTSNDLIGVYIGISSKKGAPFYGFFQEEGWVAAGKRIKTRIPGTGKRGRRGRQIEVTSGKVTKVPGKHFIEKAFNANKAAAVDVIVKSAEAAADVLARKLDF